MLRIDQLTAGYGSTPVLYDVSLEVQRGEIVCLLGPNGAGKTTVLKALVHLAQIQHGSIVFDEEDVTGVATHSLLQRGIAYVPQGRINFAGLSVRENLEMGGYVIRERATREAGIERALELFPELKPKLRLAAGSLSGGEGQMLAICRSLVVQPRLLLLDEPSLGLAPRSIAAIFEKLRTLVQAGMSILLVEQNVRLAVHVAQRGYLLAAGTVVYQGSAADLADPERMRALYLGG